MHSAKTWQVLGLTLAYPNAAFLQAAPELIRVLEQERLLSPRTLPLVVRFLREQSERPLLDVEERYAATFDGGRFLSLHLFEHVYGDGKERGQALSQLARRYAELGVALAARETPDYLPALCELASACGAQGLSVLVEARPVIELLGRALVERQSSYALVVQALVEALGAVPASTSFEFQEAAPTPPDLDALDRDWTEAPVEFGPAAAHDAIVPLRRSKDGPNAAITSAS